MKTEEFEKIWMDQVQSEKSMLLERADAYATGGDRLGNFYEGGFLNSTTPLKYGWGLVSKHIIALRDLINKLEKGEGTYTAHEAAKFEEYVTDIRNYAVLFKALYLEEKCQRRQPTTQDAL